MDILLSDLLNKKKLKVVKTIREPNDGLHRSYVLIVKDPKNVKYTVKYFSSLDKNARKRFIKDIIITKHLRKHLGQKYKTHLAEMKWYSIRGPNPFFIYKYIEGETLGDFMEDYGIKWGYFKDVNFQELVNFLCRISSYKNYDPVNEYIDKYDKYVIDKEIKHYFSNNPEMFSEDKWESIKAFLEKNKNKALKSMVYSHKDLYPENFILKQKFSTNFKLVDFEQFSLVPIGFDAAFLYLLFWKEEYWQGKIYSHYYNHYKCHNDTCNKATFEMSFRYCLLILSIRMLYQLKAYGAGGRAEYHDAVTSYKTCLEKALSGTIVKPQSIKFLIGKRELQEIGDDYGIGNILDYEVFYASKGNTVVRVETKNRECYIFRLYSTRRTKSMIKREIKIIKHLKNNNIPTYNIIENKDKEISEYKLFNIKQIVVVLTYVSGKKILRKYSNEKSALKAGEMLKNIHNLNVVHGDYGKENVLYKKEKVTGVIDFEWGRFTKSKSAKYTDLARALMLWIIDVRSKNISDIDFIMKFIEGYLDRKPSKKELTQILERVVNKIEEERETFLGISGFREHHKGLVDNRFDHAIENIYRMINEGS